MAASVDQDGTVPQCRPQVLDCRFDHGVEQRLARGDEGGGRLALGVGEVQFEGDAFVLVGDGGPAVQAARDVDDPGGDAGDFVASLLPFADLPRRSNADRKKAAM